MEISQKQQDGIVIVSIKGRLDADSSGDAEKELDVFLKENKSRFLFDLSELEYLSSAGLRVLLGVAKAGRQTDGKIVLCCLNSIVKEIFEISGFDSLIPIRDSVEEGLKEFD
jgi:anti-anti-sigma factor